jgi:hypothetical protein
MTSALPFHMRHIAVDIRAAVNAELQVARKGIAFKLLSLEVRGGVLTLLVDSNGGVLDPVGGRQS